MGQPLTLLSRNLIPLICCLIISACNGSYTAFESDRDIDIDTKTADLEQDNAELKLLGVMQSAFMGHYQSKAYDFLDANDLPATPPTSLTETGGTVTVSYDCSTAGSVTYTYTREAGEEHKKDDRVSVDYDNCVEGNETLNGTMSAKYTSIEGLNKRFTTITTDQCLLELQDKLSMNSASHQEYTYDALNQVYGRDDGVTFAKESQIAISNKSVIFVTGDELIFTRVANDIRVDLQTVELVETEDKGQEKEVTLELSFLLSEDDKALFILQPSEPTDTMVTSIDGDQIYSLVEADDTLEKCQRFERTLKATFDGFSTDQSGFLKTALDGTVTLYEAQDTPERVDQFIIDSDFKTIVTQGSVTDIYTMKDYRVEKQVNLANNSYAYEFDGFVSNSSVLDGNLQLTTFDKLYGSSLNQYPDTGRLQVLAKGLESMIVTASNLSIALQVDFNGDSTGNGLGDSDITINSTWSELFARDFKE